MEAPSKCGHGRGSSRNRRKLARACDRGKGVDEKKVVGRWVECQAFRSDGGLACTSSLESK